MFPFHVSFPEKRNQSKFLFKHFTTVLIKALNAYKVFLTSIYISSKSLVRHRLRKGFSKFQPPIYLEGKTGRRYWGDFRKMVTPKSFRIS